MLIVFICQVKTTVLSIILYTKKGRRSWLGRMDNCQPILGGLKTKVILFLSVVDFLFNVRPPTMTLLPTTLAGLSKPGGWGGTYPHPQVYGRSVKSISTRGVMSTTYYVPPRIFRPSYGPAGLKHVNKTTFMEFLFFSSNQACQQLVFGNNSALNKCS